MLFNNKRKNIYLVILGISIVILFALANTKTNFSLGSFGKNIKSLPAYDQNKCYDSDNGQYYGIKGTIYGKLTRSAFGNKSKPSPKTS